MAIMRMKPILVSAEAADKKKFIEDNLDSLVVLIKLVKFFCGFSKLLKKIVDGVGSYVIIR